MTARHFPSSHGSCSRWRATAAPGSKNRSRLNPGRSCPCVHYTRASWDQLRHKSNWNVLHGDRRSSSLHTCSPNEPIVKTWSGTISVIGFNVVADWWMSPEKPVTEATEVTCLVDKHGTMQPCRSSGLVLQNELLWLIELLLHFLSVQAEDNADIGGTIEDEDEGSDDPNLEVRNLLWTMMMMMIIIEIIDCCKGSFYLYHQDIMKAIFHCCFFLLLCKLLRCCCLKSACMLTQPSLYK